MGVDSFTGSPWLLGHCSESESLHGEESLLFETKWLNVEHKTNFAFGYLPATIAGLGEYLRAGFGTKVGHPSCGR